MSVFYLNTRTLVSNNIIRAIAILSFSNKINGTSSLRLFKSMIKSGAPSVKSVKYVRSRTVAARHVTENARPKQFGNIRVIFPNFQNCACWENIWRIVKGNGLLTKHNSLHLAQKYTLIFVREALSVPRTGQFSESAHVMKNRACCLSWLWYLFGFVDIHCSAWYSRSWGFVVMNHVPRFTVQTATCTADFTSFLVHHLHKMIHHLMK